MSDRTFSDNIIENLPEMAFVAGDGGRYKQWNSNLKAALGYTAKELTKLTVFDSIADEQRATVEELIATTLSSGMAKAESVLLSKEGIRIPCLLIGVRIMVDDRPFVLGMAVDLRKLREAENGLRKSEEQYRLLVATIPEVVWKTDAKGTILFVSPQVESLLGYSAEEFRQQGDSLWFNSVHVDDQERVSQAFDSLMRDGKPYDIECRAQKKNGEWFWAHDRAVATRDSDGFRVVTGIISDITARKAAEETVQKLASIVEFSEDAIIGKTLDGAVTSWNRAAEKIYGYTPEEAIGRNLSLLVPPERQREIQAIMTRIASGQPTEYLETQRLTKSGSLLDVSISVSPIKDPSGRITGASTIARDITLRKRTEKQLKLQSAALDAAANTVVITDHEGTIEWVNRAFTTMTGYCAEEVLGNNISLLNSGKQSKDYYAGLWSTILSGENWQGELVNKRKNGTTYIEEMTITPVSQTLGQTNNTYFIAIKQDITHRKHAEKEHQLTQFSVDHAAEAIFWSNSDGHFVYVNEAACASLGYSSEELLSRTVADLNPRFDKEEGWPTFWLKLKRLGSVRFEARSICKTGRAFPAEITATYLEFDGQEYCFAFVRDITDRRIAEDRVQFLAYYDALTGLSNRTLLQDRLSKTLASAQRRKEKVALLFLDLDRFKTINDSVGHSVGDLLLQQVAERLKRFAREQDTVARLGGDEFLILLSDIKDVPDAAIAAERLMNALSAEFVLQGHPVSIGCSVGISIYPDHGTDAETLIKNADAAMYRAKEKGRNNFQFFTDEMNSQVLERLSLESKLRLALGKGEFFLMYQPQMDIATGKIVGLEALLRWQHPELGLVPPDKFIRVAENCGLIVAMGEWVLKSACLQARKWQDEGLPAISIAVNVSAVQFRQEDFCNVIRRVLRETCLAPEYLELELTEGLLLTNADVTLSVLQELKTMGLMLAIDDFGTGYSSFNYLRQFQVSKLKIDRSFIRDLATNPNDAAITAAIINMARSLNLKVIAEGVEDEAQMTFLRKHHCDEIQGYYFSRPLAADKVAAKLQGDTSNRAQAQVSGKQ